MKAKRQPRSAAPGMSAAPMMPLMPATRPVSSMSSTAESPMSMPPAKPAMGEKSAMTDLRKCYVDGPRRRAIQ
jgi:hypothetical protein